MTLAEGPGHRIGQRPRRGDDEAKAGERPGPQAREGAQLDRHRHEQRGPWLVTPWAIDSAWWGVSRAKAAPQARGSRSVKSRP
jgi:hypothetical protein